jgi:hypothetical protein
MRASSGGGDPSDRRWATNALSPDGPKSTVTAAQQVSCATSPAGRGRWSRLPRDHLRRPTRPAASGTATTGALLNGHGKPNAVAQPLELSDDTHLDHRRNAGGYARRPDPLPELMRMEWRKNNDTRAASWLLTAIALLTTGAAMVPLCLPHEMQQRWPATSP